MLYSLFSYNRRNNKFIELDLRRLELFGFEEMIYENIYNKETFINAINKYNKIYSKYIELYPDSFPKIDLSGLDEFKWIITEVKFIDFELETI